MRTLDLRDVRLAAWEGTSAVLAGLLGAGTEQLQVRTALR